ncbi:FAD binding domain-containing protein [Salinigranum salinum]|uniref:FAD binding domain-containing protein n=1 Tax=Salinigranum salinum TaxID=1364937 RepID=UPI0012605B4E|nr:FAD binding domain-containing protein [Salinigranum salinum]
MNYYQPGSLSEASELLSAEQGAKVIAGGQSMMPLIRQDIATPDALVDITRVDELDTGVTVTDDTIEIGALVTYRELLEHDVCADLPLLRDSLEAIGDRQVRNAGTIGGGVAHADPAQDLPPALQCYGTDVVISDGESERTHDINEFFIDFYFTSLAPHELVTRVDVHRPPPGAGGAFAKHARTPGGFSEAGVAALCLPDEDGDGFTAVRVAYCAGAPVPRRAPETVEAGLTGTLTRDDVARAADGIVDSLDNVGDVGDYDEAYNDHVFRVLTKRALTTAAERSAGPEVRA